MTRRLSVIIPTHNRRERIHRCLDALEQQTLPAQNFEVVIIDDGSTDGTAEGVEGRSTSFALTVLRQSNRGPGAARNRALERPTAPLLLVINDDTLLAEDALARHLAFHEQQPTGSRKILLGNFRILPAYTADLFTSAVDSTTFMFPFCRLTTRTLLDYSYFITCNTSLPRVAFDDAGFFDENFPKPAGEDIEMGYRLYQAGWRIEYHADLMSWHDSLFTPASYARARFIRGEEDLRFLNKHPEQIRVYQRHAMAFTKSHEVRLRDNWDDYGAYIQSCVALTERHIAEHQAADSPAYRYRALHALIGDIESVGYLAYAHGAGKSPSFTRVMDNIYPQAVF